MRSPALHKVASAVRPWLPRRLSPHRVLAGPLRGAHIVTSWHDYPAGIAGITERPLLEWFRQQVVPGSTWLDIGAHYGYTAIALSRLVGHAGRVFAFEPMTTTARCIAEMRLLNGIAHLTVVADGLGCPETCTTISVPTVRGMVDRTVGKGREAANETIRVGRFDWLWPQLNGGVAAVDGIKIDVQGMELEVLEGMRETLRQQRPKLVIELHRGVSRPALFDLLRLSGYSIGGSAVEPLAGESTPLWLDDRSYAFVPGPSA